jgi:hypothetical protein
MDWSDRPNKQVSREYVLNGYKQCHAALFLPGWDEAVGECGQDIRTALRMGILDREKPLYVVEKNYEWAPLIEADLKALGFTKIVMHIGELSEVKFEHRLDFAFIDLMGCLTLSICEWMRDTLAPALAKGAIVALTVAYCKRNNHFIDAAERVMFKGRDDYKDITRAMRDLYKIEGGEKLLPFLLVKAIFQHHSFAYNPLFKYNDNVVSMLSFKFTEFAKANTPNGYPSLVDITARFTQKEHKNMVKDTPKTAAGKAWQTRRQQATAAADAEAERRAMLSERALKAWATRRENGWVHPTRRPPLAKRRNLQS